MQVAMGVLQQDGAIAGTSACQPSAAQDMACRGGMSEAGPMACDGASIYNADFMMYYWKCHPCPKPYSHEWKSCAYYHKHPSERARRRSPMAFQYSAEFCIDMDKHGACALGDACPQSHSAFESALHPDRFRTKMCSWGKFCTRNICFYAHSQQDLRKGGSNSSMERGSLSGQRWPDSCSDAVPASSMDTCTPTGAAAGGAAGAAYAVMKGATASTGPVGAAADVADAQRNMQDCSKGQGWQMPVLRVAADQGCSMQAAQQAGSGSNNTACTVSWFGASPPAPATPSGTAGVGMAAGQPQPPPRVLQQQQQTQVTQAGFRGSQDGQQQQVQCHPDTPLFAPVAGSSSSNMRTPFAAFAADASQPIGAPVRPDVDMDQVQLGFGGMRVSATTAAVYDAPASIIGSAVASLGSQPGTATAAAAAGQGGFDMHATATYTQQQQRQQQQLVQQPAGQFSGVSAATAALYAAPSGSGTTGGDSLWGTAAAAVAAQPRLGVHAMHGVQQQMIQQPQQQVYSAGMAGCSLGGAGAPAMLLQQQQPQQGQLVCMQLAPMQQQQQQVALLGLDAQAQQRLHHLQQQLQQLRLQQEQQQGMGVSSGYGSMGMALDASSMQAAAAGQFSAGPMYQQMPAAGATGTVSVFAAAGGGGGSFQPVLSQQPACLQQQQQPAFLQQQQQQQQQQVVMVPAQNMGMTGAGVMMAEPSAYQVGQSASMGMQGMPAGSMSLAFDSAAVAQQNGIGAGMFGYY